MVQNIQCSFSGYTIYPGQGKLFVRGDSRTFRFITSKEESLFHQRKNPRKLSWTVPYRKAHRKGITVETAKKRSRKTVKHQRGIVGADLAAINAKRNRPTAERKAEQEAAIAKAKEEKKKRAEERKKANKAAGGNKPQQAKTPRTKLQARR